MPDITWIKKEAPTMKQAFGCCLNGIDFKFDSGVYSSVNKAYNSHILLDDMWLPSSVPYTHLNMILNDKFTYIAKVKGFITNISECYGLLLKDFDNINVELFELIIKSNLFKMYYEQIFSNHINNYVDAYKTACKISYAFTVDFNNKHVVNNLKVYEHEKHSLYAHVVYTKKVKDEEDVLEQIIHSYDKIIITDTDLLQSLKDRTGLFNNLAESVLHVIMTDKSGYTKFMLEQMNINYYEYPFTVQEVLNSKCDVVFIGSNVSEIYTGVNPNNLFIYEE